MPLANQTSLRLLFSGARPGPCEMATQRELGQNGPGDKVMFTSATMILQF